MDSKQQNHLWYLAAAFLGLFLVQFLLSQTLVTERISDGTFLEQFEAGKIASATARAEQIKGRYRDLVDGNTSFITSIVPPDLPPRLEQSGAEFGSSGQNTFLATVLCWVVPTLLIFALWSRAAAGVTPAFTGAKLANLVNEAAILSTRRGAKVIAMTDITSALERVVADTKRKGRLLTTCARKTVATRGRGHALAAARLPGTEPVHKVPTIPRTIGALGHTLTRPTEERLLITRGTLENHMAMLLGGRAAEQTRFADLSTGAADDLVLASCFARRIATCFGMYGALGKAMLKKDRCGYPSKGHVSYTPRDHSEATGHEDDLIAGAKLLVMRETVTPAKFPRLELQEAPAE